MGNPDRQFWPGQFDDVKLVLSTEKGAVLIPNQAVQISQKGSVVCRDRSVVGSPTRAGRKTNLLTIEKMVELAAMPGRWRSQQQPRNWVIWKTVAVHVLDLLARRPWGFTPEDCGYVASGRLFCVFNGERRGDDFGCRSSDAMIASLEQ